MYYKVKLYSDLHIEFEEVSDKDAVGCTDSCYSFYESTGFGRYAIRPTREEAIQALLDSYVTTLGVIEEEYDKCKEKIDVLKSRLPKPDKCWMCKHWGSVDCWGNLTSSSRPYPSGGTRPCPFQKIKSGKRPKCMPAYSLACEYFEEYIK